MNSSTNQDLDQLNKFLRGEMSATETYEQCMDKIDDSAIERELRSLKTSHATRATMLRAKVNALGGDADDSAGIWGGFAKLVEGGAKLLGKSAAISALEEGEDHGLAMYRDNLEDLTPTTQQFVRTELLPEQKRTHDALSRLQNQV